MTLDLSSDAYDTSRLGTIIRDSEEVFSLSRIECEKTIRQIDPELSRHTLLLGPDFPNSNHKKINYVAIDGTRDILEGQTHARLFAGAFAVYGEFNKTVDITEIQRSCAFSVVSLPYKILTSGNDYVTESAGSITNLLMLLSEIYVAKSYADDNSKNLDIILLDRPLCGTLAHTKTEISSNSVLKKNRNVKSIKEDKNLESALPVFNEICENLFDKSLAEPLKFEGEHLSSDDLMYLCRVGMNALFKTCREKNIELVGLTKTTNDCSFLRLLITLNAIENRDTEKINKILSQSDDCKMLSSWSNPYQKLVCTREYDTALMTIMVDDSKKLKDIGGGGQAPQKIIVRSYMSFGLLNKGGFIFAVERLVLKNENAPVVLLPKNTEIFLYPKDGNEKQMKIFSLLKNMCTGAFPEALYYPLPLALAHRFAKSNFDYIRPRLKATGHVYGTEFGYNDLKRQFT